MGRFAVMRLMDKLDFFFSGFAAAGAIQVGNQGRWGWMCFDILVSIVLWNWRT